MLGVTLSAAAAAASTSHGPQQSPMSSRPAGQRARPSYAAQAWTSHRLRRGGARWRPGLQVQSALFDPPPFDPAKLSIRYLSGALPATLGSTRCYTLTHNDVTGNLTLSIGPHYNRQQLSGWYTRILRDEVLAEWRHGVNALPTASALALDGAGAPPRDTGSSSSACDGVTSGGAAISTPACGTAPLSLHIYCHVSGEEMWPAPPRLRSFIFQREMGLVLDTITHAEAGLLALQPELAAAPVLVHLRSDIAELDRVVEWGVLGCRATWPRSDSTMLGSLFGGGSGSWSLDSVLASVFGSATGSSDDEEGGREESGRETLPVPVPAQQQQQQQQQRRQQRRRRGSVDDTVWQQGTGRSNNGSSSAGSSTSSVPRVSVGTISTAATTANRVAANGASGGQRRRRGRTSVRKSAAPGVAVAGAVQRPRTELGSVISWQPDCDGLPPVPAVEAVLAEQPKRN